MREKIVPGERDGMARRAGILICLAAAMLHGPVMPVRAAEKGPEAQGKIAAMDTLGLPKGADMEEISEKGKALGTGWETEASWRIFQGMAGYAEWKTEAYTRGKAVLVLDASDGGAGLAETPYSFDGGRTWTADPEHEVTENGVYEALARDALGNVTCVRIVVDRIDNEAPRVAFAMEPDPWYEGKAVVRILAEDDGAGLAERAYSFDNGKTWHFYGQVTLEGPGEIRILVRDAVGNQTRAAYRAVRSGREGPEEAGRKGEDGKEEGPTEEGLEKEGKDGKAPSGTEPAEEERTDQEGGPATGQGGQEERGRSHIKEKEAGDGADRGEKEGTEGEMEGGPTEEPYGQEGEDARLWIHPYGWRERQSLPEEESDTGWLSVGRFLWEKLFIGKFFHTAWGRILLSVTALAALLSLGGSVGYLSYRKVRIYNFDGTGKYIYLGSTLFRESPECLRIRIPEGISGEAVTDRYRIRPSGLFAFLRRGQGVLVEVMPDGQAASLTIGRWMDCIPR